MATIFRPKWKRKAKDGKPAASGRLAKWYIRYRLPDGRVKTVAGFKDKKATQSKADELERKAERLAAGRGDPHEDHGRKPLVGTDDGKGKRRPGHLDDYEAHLSAKGNTARYVELTTQRIRDLFTDCGFAWLRDVDPAAVLSKLAEYRKGGMSAASSNHYLRAVKSFTRWAARPPARLPADPLQYLAAMNAEKDVRRERRALSDDEFAALIEAARKSPDELLGLSGEARAMLYNLAAFTGIRASALASLTPAAFDLEAKSPTVTVRAGYDKAGKTRTLPLNAALVPMLRAFMARKLPTAKLWPGHWADYHAAGMVRADLAAASKALRKARKLRKKDPDPLPYEDAAGRVFDFHALRGQFGTSLARRGVHPKIAQQLLGHSTIALTMKHYTRLEISDLQAAVDGLPTPPPTTAEAKATGTDGAHTPRHTPDSDNSVHVSATGSRTGKAGGKRPQKPQNP